MPCGGLLLSRVALARCCVVASTPLAEGCRRRLSFTCDDAKRLHEGLHKGPCERIWRITSRAPCGPVVVCKKCIEECAEHVSGMVKMCL